MATPNEIDNKHSLAESGKTRPKGHLRYESLLRALPPDILRELVNRKRAEVERILAHQEKPAAT